MSLFVPEIICILRHLKIMAKKKAKKKKNNILKVNATFEDLLKTAMSGNPTPKRAKK